MGEVEAAPAANGDAPKPASDNAETDKLLHERILNQIEYYFGDVNLTKDRYLNEQIKKDDGWVPIEILLTFNRLSNICSDVSTIAEAMGNSSLVKVSEDGSKLRRDPSKPMPESSEEGRKELMKRTVYCKGFPIEGMVLDDFLTFFKQFGTIDSVVMRHYMDKASGKKGFKGSTFTIFSSVEEAEKFLKLEEVKYKDTPLKRLWQSDYIDEKRQERLDNKLSKQMRRRKNGQQSEDVGDADGERKEGKKDKKETKKPLPTGSVLNLTNIPTDVEREEIRRAIESQGFPVAYIDVVKGETSGFVRLENAGAAAECITKLGESKKVTIGSGEVDVRTLETEEEANYLERARSQIARARQGRPKKGQNFRGRKRRNPCADDDSGPKAKIAARGSS